MQCVCFLSDVTLMQPLLVELALTGRGSARAGGAPAELTLQMALQQKKGLRIAKPFPSRLSCEIFHNFPEEGGPSGGALPPSAFAAAVTFLLEVSLGELCTKELRHGLRQTPESHCAPSSPKPRPGSFLFSV